MKIQDKEIPSQDVNNPDTVKLWERIMLVDDVRLSFLCASPVIDTSAHSLRRFRNSTAATNSDDLDAVPTTSSDDAPETTLQNTLR